MAEVKGVPTTIEHEVGIAAEKIKAMVDALKDHEAYSSNASTSSGLDTYSSNASNSESTSDSDSGSSKASKRKVPEANDEPMKIKVPSWPNANHPEIENMLALQKLQEDLEQSLDQMVTKVAYAGASYEHVALQEQQMYPLRPMYDPAYGYNDMGEQCGGLPLMPYLVPEYANGLPLPSYLPNLTDLDQMAAQWQAPTVQGTTVMNKNAKPFIMNKKADKANKNAAAETSCSNAAQEGDDANAAGRTVVATKINRLGFGAEKFLNDYFVHFGKIESVCVPQKIKRVQGTPPSQGHLRPSGLGFVVMETEEDAKAILAAGADHTVCGKLINVRAFKEGQNINAAVAEEN